MASFTGRMVNFMSTRVPKLLKSGTRRQVRQFRSSQGKKGNRILGKPTFVLDVVGRTSGEPRPVMLMLVRRGDDLVICGSNAGHSETPNWYKNLMAAGGGHAEVGSERWAVTARQLEDGPERDECWDLLVAGYPDFGVYQELTDRRLPVAVLTRSNG